jgi:(E)-4-hydroxy-3-methylbut-2-enyl-diphosphate synthase
MGYNYSVPLDKWNIQDMATDFIFIGDNSIDFEIPGTLGIIQNGQTWKNTSKKQHYPLWKWQDVQENINWSEELNFIQAKTENLKIEDLSKLNNVPSAVLVLTTEDDHWMPNIRTWMNELMLAKIDIPVIFRKSFNESEIDKVQLYSSTDFGGLQIDGLGDGIWLEAPNIPKKLITSTSFGILQASRTRISKTEYISCPSCGRTLFDLQETTAMIRSRTSHLKGVKIGIMGCIVNGPGEMADADYGYVGSGVGKITLYKGQEVVKKSIPSENAVDELIQLIKDHGDWVETAPSE